ncbi:hypothetical protein FRX31_013715 [Thalictrum thalictroides]|uniref:Uncharacterized protein n=1 Tax=Thalictrum thalictroides TaxID=46969 RepID=A0A7J6WIF7_THATH|nr:hypothetical protein FRX31_013715 [Thalictrum thalictroides]
MLQSWKDFNSREVASEIWAILPYALLWTVWRVRNEVIFQGGTADEYKVIQRIKATIWGWLNMSHMAKSLRDKFQFTDTLFGWQYVMIEQW